MRFVADLSLAMLILLDPYIYMYTRTCVILVYATNTRESVWVFSSMKRELEGIVRVGMELESKFVRFSNFSKIENFLKLCLVSIKRSPRDFLILL